MSRFADDEAPSSGGKTPKQTRSLEAADTSSDRKWVLYLAMLILGLPVFLVMFGPAVAGSWVLWQQIALYRRSAQWRQFSLFDAATKTADPELVARLRWPGLAACSEFRGKDGASGSGDSAAGQNAPRCSQLGPAQNWLLGLERESIVSRILRFIPVSSLFFVAALFASYLLRLIGGIGGWG